MLRSIFISILLLISLQQLSQAQQSDSAAVADSTDPYVIEQVIFSDDAFRAEFPELLDQNGEVIPADTLTMGSQRFFDERPATARLNQNYPNPFNPATTISYRLPQNSTVKIEVFDQLGRSVDILLNEPKTAGDHILTYNASHLPSGVYIYRMEIVEQESRNRQMFTRKFTLLK